MPKKLTSILATIVLAACVSASVSAAQIDDAAAEQKQAIDRMHHKLHDDQAPFKQREAQALKELNEMTVREAVDLAALHTKIDELMAAKAAIMRLRYEHLVEMRAILTDEQKVSYDQGVLKRSAVK